ncbi:Gfo/Idh/MocA family oxidoreductase, partial [Streptomyces rubiginosohelvolus]|uniref:maltokinase N-terminal cap-like domain-containing protein n=1 Tax=Streptomyces rubiginosohelvolus TaxID=67362 RepID=UPI0033CF0109
MSEAASTHVALAKSTRNSATTGSTTDGALLPSLAPLLHEWLPRQRWFAGKGRPVTGFRLVSATEMVPVHGTAGPGLLHLLLRVEQPSRSVRAADDCYQLLLGVRTSLPPVLAGALVGRVERGPLAGRTVYDALHDPRLADVLLERFRRPGSLGSLRFERTAEIPAGLAPRVLDAEQSNSSLVYGDAFILKIFRRIFPGTNPDLELPLALTGEGCERVPAPIAWFEAPGAEPLTLGVLQPFLQGARDGWQLALAALAAGKHVLCEKPLANTVAEAEGMARAAQEARDRGQAAMVGFNY